MKLRNIILGAVLSSSVFIALAQDNPVIVTQLENIIPPKQQAVLLARVNLYEPTISWNSKVNGHTTSFTLETDDPVQRDVHYRITFLDKKGAIIYAYVFDDNLTLIKGFPLTITRSFPVPINLSGTYDAVISVVNKEGLPLATGRVDKITFGSGASGAFAISNCFTDKEVYDKQESVSVACDISGNPGFGSTLVYTLYRDNRAQSFLTGRILSLNGKKVIFSFHAPAKAGAYMMYIQGYQNESTIGNTSLLPFAVRGPVSNILSLYIDRQSYQKGDSAMVTAGLSLFMLGNKAVFAEAEIMDASGMNACGPTVRTRIVQRGSISFSIPITRACDGFILTVRLLDSKGFILDEEVLNVDKGAGSRFIGFLNVFLLISALIVVLSSFVHKRRTSQH